MAQITKHAKQRAKERLGLSKKSALKNTKNALRWGIKHKETCGSLHRYIEALYWKYQTANNIRIYHDAVYIFHDGTLITVYTLPERYRGKVDEYLKANDEKELEECKYQEKTF